MIKIVTVRLGLAGKLVDYDAGLLNVSIGNICIVEDDRGKHYAEVVDYSQIKESICPTSKSPKILRLATKEDQEQIKKNREDIFQKKQVAQQKVKQSSLAMKIIDMEYVFDRSKVICYFSAKGRVDFRRLVLKLARMFHLRVELRQIGVRDHARLKGGFGRCGRELCCSSHLKKFHHVSIKMEKEQNLASLPGNSLGVCGRLMCCLAYEYDLYKNFRKNIYPKGTALELKMGKGTVVDVDILKQQLKIELWETRQIVKCGLSDVQKVIKVS
ncbi:hypothetical protein AB834_07240 [PVC group bacterium (ex Bugula neritina AB1)]|nr:hypothetical protein AB834_07240 [PVC group bacterium (ex Bugula neritina AB1)]